MRIPDPAGTPLDVTAATLAARPATLAERRVAVLDNGKPNARHVVRTLAGHLESRFRTETPLATGKALASRPAPDEVLVGFRNFDAAIVGVGD